MATTEDLQKLIVRLEAQTAQFEKQLAKAERTAAQKTAAIQSKFSKMNTNISTGFQRMNTSFARFAGAAGLIYGVDRAIGAFIGSMTEAIDKSSTFVDLSKRLKIPTDTLQELAYQAEQSGGTLQDLATGLTFFVRAIGTARREETEFGKILDINGVKWREQADGTIPDVMEVYRQYIELVQNTKDETKKLNLQTIGFGRGGTVLTEMMEGGTEAMREFAIAAHKAGLVIDRDLLEQAEQFGDEWATTVGTIRTFFRKLVIEFIGDLNELVEEITAWRDRIVGLWNTASKAVIDFIDSVIKTVTELLTAFRDKVAEIIADIVGFFTSIGEAISGIATTVYETLMPAFDAINAAAKAIGDWFDRWRVKLYNIRVMLTGIGTMVKNIEELEGRPQPVTPGPIPPDYRAPYVPPAPRAPAVPAPDVPAGTPDDPLVIEPTDAFKQQLQEYKEGGGPRYLQEEDVPSSVNRPGPDFDYAVGPAAAPVIDYGKPGTPAPGTVKAATGVDDTTPPEPPAVDEYNRTDETLFPSDEYDEAARAAAQAQEQIDGVTESLEFEQAQLTRTAREQEIYNALSQAGVDINSEAGQRIAALAGALYDQRLALERIVEEMDFLREAAKSFTETLVQGLADGADATETLSNALRQLGSRLISSGIDQLFNILLGAPGTPGFLGAIFGRQTGGPIEPGRAYRVHKDELIVPRHAGSVIPAYLAKGGGGVALSYAPAITIMGNADDRTITNMRDRLLIDVEQRLPGMIRSANRDRRL